MPALHEPGPECHGDRRQPDLPLVLIDRWAQLAAERPSWYVASWAIGIGAVNLGLCMLLNGISLARNTGMAILTAVGFFVFAWLYTIQRTRRLRQLRLRPAANPAVPEHSCAARWGLRGPWPPVRGWRRPPVRAALVVPTMHGGVGQARRPTANSIRAPEAAPGPGRGRRPRHHRRPTCWVPSLAEVLFLGEVTMWSSEAGGIEGHQWTLHRTSGTRLPCRIVCECCWTSTAGQRTAVLLQLKGHLEDSLHSGARLLSAHDQPPAEIPNTRPN
jgi:hypothetical protein